MAEQADLIGRNWEPAEVLPSALAWGAAVGIAVLAVGAAVYFAATRPPGRSVWRVLAMVLLATWLPLVAALFVYGQQDAHRAAKRLPPRSRAAYTLTATAVPTIGISVVLGIGVVACMAADWATKD